MCYLYFARRNVPWEALFYRPLIHPVSSNNNHTRSANRFSDPTDLHQLVIAVFSYEYSHAPVASTRRQYLCQKRGQFSPNLYNELDSGQPSPCSAMSSRVPHEMRHDARFILAKGGLSRWANNSVPRSQREAGCTNATSPLDVGAAIFDTEVGMRA
jgi:hypothetical protein